MLTIRAILQTATAELMTKSETPRLDAEVLLAHVLQASRSYIYSWPEEKLSSQAIKRFNACLVRRLQREPIAYICGQAEFWSLRLNVQNTLVPRPETEHLVQAVLAYYPSKLADQTCLDLGTGSGAIALAIASERPKWRMLASEKCPRALQTAQANATKMGVSINFVLSDWYAELTERVDIIVSNPPYISSAEWPHYQPYLKHEPYQALVSGPDGLDATRIIVNQAKDFLKPNGTLFLEHGRSQDQAVRELFRQAAFENIVTIADLAKHPRCTYASLAKGS